MARKLVTVRQISGLCRVEGSRGICMATIDGWTCAVPGDGGFRVGDRVVFFQVDAFLPCPAVDARFGLPHNPVHHQQTTFGGRRGVHVRSVMIGKRHISQGVVLRLDAFPEIVEALAGAGGEAGDAEDHGDLRDDRNELEDHGDLEVHGGDSEKQDKNLEDQGGDLNHDVDLDHDGDLDHDADPEFPGVCFAEKLGILKWELDPPKLAHSLGDPPAFIPSTHKAARAQDCPNLFTKPKYRTAVYQESVKMDGASMTAYFVRKDSAWHKSVPVLPMTDKGKDFKYAADMDNGRFGICSSRADIPEDTQHHLFRRFWEAAHRTGLPRLLAGLGQNLAIQGELVGSTIRGNRHGLDEGAHEFHVFSSFDIDRQEMVDPRRTVARCERFGLRHVPVLGYVTFPSIARCHADLLERAKGFQGPNGRRREGLVYKSLDDGRSIKVIDNEYMLEIGE